jgi:hypothetical protein
MRKILKDIALVLGIVVSLVTLIGFFSGRLSLPVNLGVKLLEFYQLSYYSVFPPLASQAKFWEPLKEEHLLINRVIAQKSAV